MANPDSNDADEEAAGVFELSVIRLAGVPPRSPLAIALLPNISSASANNCAAPVDGKR
jgi:hypothetical protein